MGIFESIQELESLSILDVPDQVISVIVVVEKAGVQVAGQTK